MKILLSILVIVSFLGVGWFSGAMAGEIDSTDQYKAQKESSSPGVTYIRWGRSECPTGVTVLYDGFVSGSYYSHHGGTSNLICLPNEPGYVQTGQCQECSWLYSTEYETHNQVFSGETYNYDAPCVACLALEKTTSIMIPGKTSCPNSLQTEYSGYLMSTKNEFYHATDAICVDGNAEVVLGSSESTEGATLYFAVADCNLSFIPCAPYKHLVPISCAVCSY